MLKMSASLPHLKEKFNTIMPCYLYPYCKEGILWLCAFLPLLFTLVLFTIVVTLLSHMVNFKLSSNILIRSHILKHFSTTERSATNFKQK